MADVLDDVTTTAVLELNAAGTAGTYSGQIEIAGDHDWIRVTLQAFTTYDFFLGCQPTGPASIIPATMTLRDSDGTAFFTDTDGGAGANAFVSFTPSTSGTFFIDVSSNARGIYGLAMTSLPATNVFGTDGPDTLSGNAGERLAGGASADVLNMISQGTDALGEQGDDILVGSALGNLLIGGLGSDFVSGGDGNDIIFGDRRRSAHRRGRL